jgi:molecular chaperone Hsp33
MNETAAAPQIGDDLGDDIVLPFRTVRSGVIGRVVRLGPAIDTILSRHDMPPPVAQVLGEAVALTTMLGAALKFAGKLIVQTKTDGLIDFLVVNFDAGGRVRGYARYDKKRFAELAAGGPAIEQGVLLGRGHLAITIDQGGDMDRYQGIVALEGESLTEAALAYFRQSEQLPTFLRLAVARHYQAGEGGRGGTWQWRAGGLMIQTLAKAGGTSQTPRPEGIHEAELQDEQAEDWQRAKILAATVEDHELLDPTLSPQRLLYRLFHEEGVRTLPPTAVEAYCQCSRERVEAFLRSFGEEGLGDMREPDGSIKVTCEFCAASYRFEPGEIG